jgi:hypothetical protein
MTHWSERLYVPRPTAYRFDGAGDALEAARAFEAQTVESLDYAVTYNRNDLGEGWTVLVYRSSSLPLGRTIVGWLHPAEES